VAAKRQHRLDDDASGAPSGGPERLCAVTRVAGEPDGLIRFVLSPDGFIVPDLERCLPGRGVWLTCDHRIVKKAIQTKAFGRSLKSAVSVPSDLVERLDVMLVRRASDALSLATKAGYAVAGFQQVDSALEKGSIAAVLHGADAAADGSNKLDRKFKAIQSDRGATAPVCRVLTIAEMSLAMGRPSVVHAGLLPGGLTKRFLREAERVSRYRSSSAVSGHDYDDAADGASPDVSRTEG
jgi:uncharacterized protein